MQLCPALAKPPWWRAVGRLDGPREVAEDPMTGGGWVGLPRGGVAGGCALGPGQGDATLGDRLYAQILERILGGEFMPDTRLPSEAQLAGRFAVSRPIVREVLARLRDHGYVASRRG